MAKKTNTEDINGDELLQNIKKDARGYLLGFNNRPRSMMGFLHSYYELSQELGKKDRADLLDAILNYSFKGIQPTFKKSTLSNYFLLILPHLRRNLILWYNGTQRKDGIANNPSGHNQYKGNQEDNAHDLESKEDSKEDSKRKAKRIAIPLYKDKDKEKDIKKLSDESKKVPTGGTPSSSKNRGFEIPSLEDVKAYGASIGVTEAQAEIYHDSKTANGWTLGNGKSVKDWRADLRVWKRKGYLDSKQPTSTRTNAPATGATITPKWVE